MYLYAVYYCRTYEKAVSGGGGREKGGHVLRAWMPVGMAFMIQTQE